MHKLFFIFSNRTNHLKIHSWHRLSYHNNGFWFLHLHIGFRFLKKKLNFQLKMQNPQFSHIFSNFSSQIVEYQKILLQPFWADPGDAFTYPGRLRISFSWKDRLWWKKFQIFISLANSLMATSKRILKSWFFKQNNFFFIEF